MPAGNPGYVLARHAARTPGQGRVRDHHRRRAGNNGHCNHGARDAGTPSVGLNIELPSEQRPTHRAFDVAAVSTPARMKVIPTPSDNACGAVLRLSCQTCCVVPSAGHVRGDAERRVDRLGEGAKENRWLLAAS
jgi:hypothetical protein